MENEIVVVVATHGAAPLLSRMLESLVICEKPDSYVKVIVSENGPKGRAEQIADDFSHKLRIEYVYISDAGKSFGLNEALNGLGDDVLMIYFDDDVRLSESVIMAYDCASRYKGKGFYYGGPLGVDYETEPPAWIRGYLPVSAKGWAPEPSHIHKSFYGANWAAYVGDVKMVGGYNVHIGAGTILSGEETEIQERMRERGILPVYVPEALVWHYVPKERSSPMWALKRAFRDGAYQGRKLKHQYPVVGTKGVLRYLVKSAVKAGSSIRDKGFFHAIHTFSHRMGDLYGKTSRDQSSSI